MLSENLLAGSLIRLTALRESDTEVMALSRDDATFWRLQSTTPAAPMLRSEGEASHEG